jgi:hypothetical protein
MSDKHQIAHSIAAAPTYLRRVAANDSVKKGVAAAVAGVLIAAISEAIWPSRSLPI